MVTQAEYAALMWKLKAWVAAHPKPDTPIIGVAGENEVLTPRQIVREVEKRTPRGEQFIDRWLSLVSFDQIMAAPFASEISKGKSSEAD